MYKVWLPTLLSTESPPVPQLYLQTSVVVWELTVLLPAKYTYPTTCASLVHTQSDSKSSYP